MPVLIVHPKKFWKWISLWICLFRFVSYPMLNVHWWCLCAEAVFSAVTNWIKNPPCLKLMGVLEPHCAFGGEMFDVFYKLGKNSALCLYQYLEVLGLYQNILCCCLTSWVWAVLQTFWCDKYMTTVSDGQNVQADISRTPK